MPAPVPLHNAVPRGDIVASKNVVHPIEVAWVSAGGTGAPNYDEFASGDEVTADITRRPNSVLAVEMPHCAPEARAAGTSFADALPAAARRLQSLKEDGHFRRHADIVAPYRITSEAGVTYGVLAMVDTHEISMAADEPGRVIRNEDVFAATVAERTALIGRLQHLLSPVLLLAADDGPDLDAILGEVVGTLSPPAVSDTDPAGRTHDVWVLAAGAQRDRVLAALNTGRLIVADGNHRSLAAQQAGLPRFLALITGPGSVHIQPYNRLVERLGMSGAEFRQRLAAAGARVVPAGGLAVPTEPGTVAVYLAGTTYDVTVPAVVGTVVDRLDHAVVERVMLSQVLGLAAGDPAVRYVGGDYPASWLAGEVDAGRAEAAICICPVSVADFVAVNIERLKMPRKSTWFTPKARAGLVLAELSGGLRTP